MPTLIWEGDPSDLAPAEMYSEVENWHADRPPKVGGSVAFLGARTSMENAFRIQWEGGSMIGPVSLRVTSYWPSMFDDGPCDGQAIGQVQAVHTAIVNALYRARILQRREQVGGMISIKRTDAARPRIEVEVKHWDDGGVA